MAIEVSREGIEQASQSLLNSASELSEIFDNISQITDSISTNVTGFTQAGELSAALKEMQTLKDSIVSKMNEFGNYLTSTVIEGYDSFVKALDSIEIDTSFLTTLASLFEVKFESNTFNLNSTSESTLTSDNLISQVKPIANEETTIDSNPEETGSDDASAGVVSSEDTSTSGTYTAKKIENISSFGLKKATPIKQVKPPKKRGDVELPADPYPPVKY